MNTEKNIMSHVGSIQQLAYIRPIMFMEGRAKGLKAFHVKNENISFTVMEDKCLDIAELSYKGINFSFLSKPGLMGKAHYDTNEKEASRSIMGGLLFTCGLENICAPCELDGKKYPMHGRMRTTPAENVCSNTFWHDDKYFLAISGEMREAEIFGENMVLRRKIITQFGEKSILIEDEIENQSFRKEPMMILYHFNFGYPFLNDSCELFMPTNNVHPRDEISRKNLTNWNVMDKPKDNEEEYVFIHTLDSDNDCNTMVAIINKNINMGITIEFNKEYLPHFAQWKSTGAGDYVIGLEPSNSSVYGRIYHTENDNVHTLNSFEKENIKLKFSIVDGIEEIELCKKKIENLRR